MIKNRQEKGITPIALVITIVSLSIIVVIILANIITFGLDNFFPGRQTNKKALKYMEEKYDEVFTYSAPYGDSMSGTREFLVTCESIPDKQILVQVENFREDNPIYKDNYIAVKYEEKTSELIRSCAKLYGINANVFYEARKEGLPEDLPVDASFEQFLANNSTEMIVMIEIKNSEFKNREQVEQICKKIDDVSYSNELWVAVAVVRDEYFGTMNRRELNSCAGLFLSNNSSISNNSKLEAYMTSSIRNGEGIEFDWCDDR